MTNARYLVSRNKREGEYFGKVFMPNNKKNFKPRHCRAKTLDENLINKKGGLSG